MRPATAPAVAVPGSAEGGVQSAECRVQSAECGVKGKKPNSCAGSGQNPGDATVAHLAGGLVRRALFERPTAGNRGSGTGNGSQECRMQSEKLKQRQRRRSHAKDT